MALNHEPLMVNLHKNYYCKVVLTRKLPIFGPFTIVEPLYK